MNAPEVDTNLLLFDGMLQDMERIERGVEQAPPEDVEYHELALAVIKHQAREHLVENPDVLVMYRTAGEWAVDATVDKLEASKASVLSLKAYVEQGLLDALTIEELEERLVTLQRRSLVLPHLEVVREVFGDLLVETPEEPAEQLNTTFEALPALETLPLSAAMREFLQAAVDGKANLLQLRAQEGPMGKLDEKAYSDLKRLLSAERRQVIEHLAENGVQADWIIEKNTRARTYQLVVAGQILPTSPQSAVTKAAKAPRARRPESPPRTSDEMKKFDHELFVVARYIVSSSPEGDVRQSYASERIAEWLDITTGHANDLVERLKSQQLVVETGKRHGSALIKMSDVQLMEEVVEAPAQDAVRRKSSIGRGMGFSEEERDLAGTFCGLIQKTGSYDKGVSTERLAKDCGITEREARMLASKMEKAGVCKLRPAASTSSIGGQGKRVVMTLVKFPSQGALSRFITDPRDYLKILPVGSVD